MAFAYAGMSCFCSSHDGKNYWQIRASIIAFSGGTVSRLWMGGIAPAYSKKAERVFSRLMSLLLQVWASEVPTPIEKGRRALCCRRGLACSGLVQHCYIASSYRDFQNLATPARWQRGWVPKSMRCGPAN